MPNGLDCYGDGTGGTKRAADWAIIVAAALALWITAQRRQIPQVSREP